MSVDYEHLYRETERQRLELLQESTVAEGVCDFINAVEDGEGEAEAYRRMLERFCEFAHMGQYHLSDVGEFDPNHPSDGALRFAVQTLDCVAGGKMEIAADSGQRMCAELTALGVEVPDVE